MNEMTGSKKSARIEYLDGLKAVSMLLVIFCHLTMLSRDSVLGNALMALAWTAVPCFMMTSGALMHRKETFDTKKYFRRIVRLYAAYLIWRLIYYVLYSVGGAVEQPSVTQLIKFLFLGNYAPGINAGAMWYIIAYIYVLLLYPITHFLFFGGKRGRRILALLGCIACVGGIVLPSAEWAANKVLTGMGRQEVTFKLIIRIFSLGEYANMLFYFILGAFLFGYREEIGAFFEKRRFLPYAAVILGTFGLMLVKYVDTGTFIWGHTYISSGYTHVSTIIASAGLYLCAATSHADSLNRFLGRTIGRNTMGIYYTHVPFLTLLVACTRSFLEPYYSVGLNIAKTIAAAVVCTIVTMVMRKIPGVRMLVE